MRWPWNRRSGKGLAEAQAALAEAEARALEAKQMQREMRRLRAENHFAEAIRASMGGTQ